MFDKTGIAGAVLETLDHYLIMYVCNDQACDAHQGILTLFSQLAVVATLHNNAPRHFYFSKK